MKLRANNAATLLECSIYLGCSALLSVIIFSFSSQTYNYFVLARTIFCSNLRQELALDLIRKDLWSATRFVGDYVPDRFIFKKEFLDGTGAVCCCFVGWECCKDGLKRVEGDYDVQARRWRRRVVSRLPARFASLRVMVMLDKQFAHVIGCTICWTLEKDNRRYQEHITIGAGTV